MNYGEPHQQQQYYVQQRMAQPTQRMGMPPQQQQIQQQVVAGMIPQPQQQRMPMVYQQQQMMRVPQHILQQGVANQQHQQQQFRTLLQNLPPAMQAQINAERDPERRRQLFQSVIQRQQQQLFEQQQMAMMQPGSTGQMRAMTPRMPMTQTTTGGQMPLTFAATTTSQQQFPLQQQQSSPIHIQRIPSQGSFVPSPVSNQTISQPRSNQQQLFAGTQNVSGTGLQLRATMPVNHPQFMQQQMNQQHFQKQFDANTLSASQTPLQPGADTSPVASRTDQQYNTSFTAANTTSGSVGSIPVTSGQIQSATFASRVELQPVRTDQYQYSSVGSVGDSNSAVTSVATQQQQQVDMEEPEYRALLKQLCKYHGDVKRLLGRLELDTPPGMEVKIKASLVNVIQVMEGTRKGGPVTKSLLQKLLSNVQTVLERYHISRHLFNTAKKLSSLHTATKEQFMLDPWKNVRHLQIKIPDHVLTILEEEKSTIRDNKKEKSNEATGRKRTYQTGEKEEDEGRAEPPPKKSLLISVADSFASAKWDQNGREKEEKRGAEGQYRIGCLDGTELVLNGRVAEALRGAEGRGFVVQTEAPDMEPPISSNSPAVHIRFGTEQCAPNSLAPVLDVLFPLDYPRVPLELCSSGLDSAVEHLLERIDSGSVDMHSLDALLAEWIALFARCEPL